MHIRRIGPRKGSSNNVDITHDESDTQNECMKEVLEHTKDSGEDYE